MAHIAAKYDPTNTDIANYLQEILSAYDNTFQVNYNPPQSKNDSGFFSITRTIQSGGILKANLKMEMGGESHFQTTYGGRTGIDPVTGMPRVVRERSPLVLTTTGRHAYSVSGTLLSQSTAIPRAGSQDQYDLDIRHQMRSPLESLAAVVSTGFSDIEKENGLRGASQTGDVTGKIMNLLSAGSDPDRKASVTIPAGTLLVSTDPNVEVAAIQRKAATSLSIVNELDKRLSKSGLPLVDEFRQVDEISRSRTDMLSLGIPFEGTKGKTYSFLREQGFAPDRSSGNRWVAWAQGTQAVFDKYGQQINDEIFLPTEKIKHETIVWTGRQQATLLDKNMQPIEATPITNKSPLSGYRQTTADVGGRIPERSLVLGTLFSPQFPIPGAGRYYPETIDEEVASGGYATTSRFGITRNIRDMLLGKTNIELKHKAGDILPSGLSFDVLSMRTAMMDEHDPDYVLRDRAGAHSFVVGQQQIRIPKYYNREGIGASFDENLIKRKQLQVVTDQQVMQLSKRFGVPVVTDATVSEAALEMSGYSKVGAKAGGAGQKYDPVPSAGKPMISIPGRELPISAMTWEAKQMLETFTTSLGAISPNAQMGLLRDYEKSLRASAGPNNQNLDIAKNVASAIQTWKAIRTANPSERLDLQELANQIQGTATDFPVHLLTKDIFQRVLLGGKTTDQFASMTEADLSEFAQSDLNLRNLKRYGMGYVSPEMSSTVEETWSETQVNDLLSAYQRANNLSPEAARSAFSQKYGFDLGNAKKGMVARSFNPSGFYLPAIAGPSVEFSGGGVLGAEEAQILNAVMPGYAARLGIAMTGKAGENEFSTQRRSPVREAQAQLAHIAMAEMDRTDDQYTKIAGAFTIDTDKAIRMMQDPDFMALLSDKASDLAGMQKFSEKLDLMFPGEKLSERPIDFAVAPGRYLGSTKAYSALATESTSTSQGELRTGEDLTRTWNMFQSAFSKGIIAQIGEDKQGVLDATQNITTHFMNQFGLPEGNKQDVIKKLLGTDVGAASGHYAFAENLRQEEIYATKEKFKEVIRTELAAQGMDTPEHPLTDEEVEQTYRLIAGLPSNVGNASKDLIAKGVPGVGLRYPIVAGEESMLGFRFVTAEHMARSGRTVPLDDKSGLSNLHFRMGVGPSGVFQGDYDLDYLRALLGIQGTREKGKLGITFAGYTDKNRLRSETKKYIQSTANMNVEDMQAILYPSKEARERFDPLLQAFKDREPEGQRGTMSQVAKMINDQFAKSKWYTIDSLLKNSASYSGAKMMMGTGYNFTRALEASAGVAGWSTESIMTGRRGRAQIYQPFLDLQTSVASPIQEMYWTSHLKEGAGEKLGIGWGQYTDQGLQFIRGAGTVNELTARNATTVMSMMAGSAIRKSPANELPGPELLAYAFSPEQNRMFTADDQQERSTELFAKWQAAEQATGDEFAKREEYMTEYYQSTGLANALEVPFSREGTIDERAEAMQQTLVGWMKANYTGSDEEREKMFQGNLMVSMFSKALNSAVKKNPNFTLPKGFVTSRLGQRLLNKAKIQEPLFNLMKGGLRGGLSLSKVMRAMEGTSTLASWAKGNLRDRIGLETDTIQYAEAPVDPLVSLSTHDKLLYQSYNQQKTAGTFTGTLDEFMKEARKQEEQLNAGIGVSQKTTMSPEQALEEAQDKYQTSPNYQPSEPLPFENAPAPAAGGGNSGNIPPDQPAAPATPEEPEPGQTDPLRQEMNDAASEYNKLLNMSPQQRTKQHTEQLKAAKERWVNARQAFSQAQPQQPINQPPQQGQPPSPPPAQQTSNAARPIGAPADSAATERAQRFNRLYQEYVPDITRQSGELQAALSAITGSNAGPLGVSKVLESQNITEAQRQTIFERFRGVGQQASQLLKLGKTVHGDIVKGLVDPRAGDLSKLQELTENVLLTNNPTGENIVDIIAAGGIGASKGGQAFMRQAMASALGSDIMNANLISNIRGVVGANVNTASGAPIMDLRDIVTSGGLASNNVNFEALAKFLAPGTEAAGLVNKSWRITGGAGIGNRFGKTAEEIFAGSPEVLQMGQLAEQLGAAPEFAHLISRKGPEAQDQESQISQVIRGFHFKELSEITGKLVKNFEALSAGQIKHQDALKIETDLLQQRTEAKKRQTVSEKAIPLVEAGLLQPEGVIENGKQRIRYRETGQPVPPELFKASEAYDEALLKSEGMPETEGQEGLIGGIRPSFMRRVLGGFGLMYMRSLGNIITGGLGYGQQERLSMEDLFGASAGAMTGTGYAGNNQMRVLQNRIALGGQAVNPLYGFQMAVAQNPGLQDIQTAAGAGFGTYALLQQAALWGGPESVFAQMANGGLSIGKTGMKLTTPWVVGGAITASMFAQASAKSQDIEGLAYRFGTGTGLSNAFSFTDAMGAAMSGDLDTFGNRAERYKLIQEQLKSGTSAVPSNIMGWIPQEEQAWYNQAYQKVLLKQNPEFAPETISAAYQFSLRNNIDLRNFKTIAGQFQTGYNEETMSGMLSVFGMGMGQQLAPTPTWAGGPAPSNLGVAYMQSLGLVNTQNMPQFQAGLQYASQLGNAPEIMRQQYGLSTKEMVDRILEWGGLSGMARQQHSAQMGVYEQMSGMGWNVEAPQLPTGEVSPEQLQTTLEQAQRQLDMVGKINTAAMGFGSRFGFSTQEQATFKTDMQDLYESGRYTSALGDILTGAANMDPYSMTRMYTLQQPGGILSGRGPQIPDWMVTKDVWGPGMGDLAGTAVNLPAFTVSGATHPQFQNLSKLLGQNFMQSFGQTGAGQAFLNGYQMQGTNMPAIAGIMGYQMYAADQQWALQQQQMGIQSRSHALQLEYLPRIWGLQDQLTNLGYNQQQWQFGQQAEQLAMNRQNFYQNIGMNMYQSQLQRGWTQQDWAFQGETRSMQWGWKQEDYQENLRFMTGRDRRLAERQMERETIMYGREGEQIDRQKARQEELWQLEDKRYEIQISQFEQQHKMQEESLKKQKEFYEEQFRLQKQLTELQRELTMKQLALQQESVALQRQMAEEAHKMQQTQMAINLLMLASQTGMEEVALKGGDFSTWMKEWLDKWLEGLDKSSNNTPAPVGGGAGGAGGGGGGGSLPLPADTLPNAPSNPWKSSPIVRKGGDSGQKREQIIVVTIGNEELKRYIVQAVGDEVS